MKPAELFNRTFQLLEQSLHLRASLHQTLAANIANKDTPHYRAFEIEVEKALQSRPSEPSSGDLSRTHGRHLPGRHAGFGEPVPRERHSPAVQFKTNGNTVDIDREMTDLAENGLLFGANAQMLSMKIKSLKQVLTGGGSAS